MKEARAIEKPAIKMSRIIETVGLKTRLRRDLVVIRGTLRFSFIVFLKGNGEWDTAC